MATVSSDPVEERRRYVDAWNETMIKIWQEKIFTYKIIDRGKLYHSPALITFRPDGRIVDIQIEFSFLEYGLWQDLGTGREFAIGNPGDVESQGATYREEHNLNEPRKRGPKWGGGYTSGKPRTRRRWFSSKYYSSVMNLRDYMAESLCHEFIGMFTRLDADKYRRTSNYYKRKGLT